MSQLQVMKFGGTSMGSLDAMGKAAALVLRYPHAKFIVVSATSGTTNQLLQIYNQALEKKSLVAADLIGAVCHKHKEMALGLGLQEDGCLALGALFAELQEKSESIRTRSDRELDSFLSIGERLSSVLFAQALRNAGRDARSIDARTMLCTDSRFGKAEPHPEESRRLCDEKAQPLLGEGCTLVTQGFIASDQEGITTTLGRGGSDYSAALFSEALGAESCWIWTDVNGIYSMDPRIVPGAVAIPEISFNEAAELANFGAKVLHPATLLPAMRAGIKVFVGNTFAPEKGGTWIYPDLTDRPLLRAIAVRERQTLITVTSMRMLNAHGFLARLFAILAEFGLSVDVVTTSEVSVALTIDETNAGSSGRSILKNQSLMNALKEIAEVQVEEGLSLVALVGNGLSNTPGVAARAFQAVGLENVRLICHGASPHNLCFLVSSSQVNRVACRLHEAFI